MPRKNRIAVANYPPHIVQRGHNRKAVFVSDNDRLAYLTTLRDSGRHTRRINRLDRRTGTSWEGRCKCSRIESDRYLLACARYVDLKPVRAKIVARPEHYRWSSYKARIGIDTCEWQESWSVLSRAGQHERGTTKTCTRFVGDVIRHEAVLTSTPVRENKSRREERFLIVHWLKKLALACRSAVSSLVPW